MITIYMTEIAAIEGSAYSRTSALRGHEQRGCEFVERENRGEQPAAHEPGCQERQRDREQDAMGWRAEARGGILEAPIEAA